MQRKGLGGLVDGLFNQRWREQKTPLPVVGGTDGQQVMLQTIRHLSDTQFFKQIQRGVINAPQIRISQRLVDPTDLARRAWINGGLCCALRQSFATASSFNSLSRHDRSDACILSAIEGGVDEQGNLLGVIIIYLKAIFDLLIFSTFSLRHRQQERLVSANSRSEARPK